jgi:membrane-associated phospholipid phosphatase
MAENRLQRAYRGVGLLPLLSALSLLVAALVHHESRLPGPYTWFEPLRTLRTVLGSAGFPSAVLAAYALGRWARRAEWDVETAARQLARDIVVRDFLPLALRCVLCVCVVIVIDGVLVGSERGLLDLVALAAIGLVLAVQRPDRRRIARELAYAVLSSAIFLVVCYCFTVSKALLFASGRHYDAAIIGLEASLFGFVPHRVLAMWATAHPALAELSDWVYFHFFEHMALVTVLLVALRKRTEGTEYLGALALCYLIGGLAYHAFPAWGPSYAEPQYFEFLKQRSLTASGIRRWLEYNTDGVAHGTARELRTWGYVACMPSLHVAHELVILYYSRSSRPAFLLSLAFTLLTLLAVVVLGWHYPLDSLGGALIAAVAIAIARWQRRVLMPAAIAPEEDSTTLSAHPVVVPFLKAYLAARRPRQGDT